MEEADAGVAVGRHGLAVGKSPEPAGIPHRVFHVGLAGAEPDFADHDVAEDHGRAGVEDEFERPAGASGGEFERPFAVRAGFDRDRGAAEAPAHFGAGRGGAANPHRPVALEHHVVSVAAAHRKRGRGEGLDAREERRGGGERETECHGGGGGGESLGERFVDGL